MANKKDKGPEIIGKAKDGKPVINRFDEDWDGLPNFKLTPTKGAAKKPPAKKPAKKK